MVAPIVAAAAVQSAAGKVNQVGGGAVKELSEDPRATESARGEELGGKRFLAASAATPKDPTEQILGAAGGAGAGLAAGGIGAGLFGGKGKGGEPPPPPPDKPAEPPPPGIGGAGGAAQGGAGGSAVAEASGGEVAAILSTIARDGLSEKSGGSKTQGAGSVI